VWTSADLTGDSRATRPMLLRSDTLDAEWSSAWTPPLLSRDSLGFLQFTSGSTSSPRGVMVTHGNLLHNLMSGFTGGETGHETVSVSWLPVTHDMGLIEGVLQPAFSGCPAYLMSPGSFLQRPMRWLTAMSRYRATRSGGPNFAYDLAVSRGVYAERLALDLSQWTSAYNGAEPVRADTMAAFAEAYGSAGFRASAFIPCYGLAESTLLVSYGRWESADGTESPVSCGAATSGTHVRVVDPVSDRVCRDGDLGEIRVAGPSVAQGYWNDDEETHRVFVTMANSDARWLRTGDLGFLRNGRLYVTGRLKDLLIVRGAKHFPQDVERTTEALHPAIFRGGVTAVAVASGVRGDHVVVIAEIDPRQLERSRPMTDVIAAIREAIAEVHGIQLHAIALVRYGAVPKTTSGKPRRYLCRDAWIQGTLQPMAQWTSPRC
jgi:acyl-CoA synthetase (AMP-forming)/AMP-acid ligase II